MTNTLVFAQEPGEELEVLNNGIMFSLGFTHIPNGAELNTTDAKGYFVPTVGFDYIRRFGDRWEFGLMLDYELDHYVIVEDELERENAFIVVVGAAVRLIDHLFVFAGPGVDLEKNQHLFVLRAGVEYGIHFSERWVLAPAFFFDWKENFNTYALSLNVGYNF